MRNYKNSEMITTEIAEWHRDRDTVRLITFNWFSIEMRLIVWNWDLHCSIGLVPSSPAEPLESTVPTRHSMQMKLSLRKPQSPPSRAKTPLDDNQTKQRDVASNEDKLNLMIEHGTMCSSASARDSFFFSAESEKNANCKFQAQPESLPPMESSLIGGRLGRFVQVPRWEALKSTESQV